MTDETPRHTIPVVVGDRVVYRDVDEIQAKTLAWPEEPKGISQAEVLLYAELAGAVRVAGVAADAAQRSYGLVCRHAYAIKDQTGTIPSDLDQLINVAYAQQASAVRFHRSLAQAALQRLPEPESFFSAPEQTLGRPMNRDELRDQFERPHKGL